MRTFREKLVIKHTKNKEGIVTVKVSYNDK